MLICAILSNKYNFYHYYYYYYCYYYYYYYYYHCFSSAGAYQRIVPVFGNFRSKCSVVQ